MPKQLRIDIIVDDDGAVQKFRAVDEAMVRSTENAKRASAGFVDYNANLKGGVTLLDAYGRQVKTADDAQTKFTEKKKDAAKQTGLYAQAVDFLSSMLGAYLGAAAIGGAILKTLEYGASLEKAAQQLGATSGAVQRLENIAVSSNTNLQALTLAITNMQTRLASGDNSAVAAVTRLGLSVNQLFAMNPDQQFIAIAKALQQIHGSEQQLQLAKDIFGRNAVEVIGALKGNVIELSEAVGVMSAKQVADLARAETAWSTFWLGVKRYSGLALAEVFDYINDPRGLKKGAGMLMPDLPDLPRAPDNSGQIPGALVTTGIEAATRAIQELEAAARPAQTILNEMMGAPAVAKAENYLKAISDLKSIGLTPLKSSWDDIVTVMTDAIHKMEEAGRTGEAMYRQMIAARNQFLGLEDNGTLKSRRVDVSSIQQVTPTASISDEMTQAIRTAQMLIEEERELKRRGDDYTQSLTDGLVIVGETADQTKARLSSQTQSLTDGVVVIGQATTAHHAMSDAATSATSLATQGWAGLGAQIQLTGDALREWVNLQRYSAAASAILAENPLFTTAQQYERIANIPRRAYGGPANAGQPVIVGDGGRPEMFVPNESGRILPRVPGGGGMTVVINAQGAIFDTERTVDQFATKILGRLNAQYGAA